MSTTIYMSLELPTPTVTVGPEWANELNTALEVVDEHDHSPGKGVQIGTAGINIDNDLNLNDNELVGTNSVQLNSLGSTLTGPTNAGKVQNTNGDLWYTNGSGTAVQITSGGSITSPSSDNTPAGIVLPYAGASSPAGYLLCDGTAVSRTTYATLFGVIGTTYGVGDGSTTFNVPNMNGRVPMGAGNYTDSVSGSITRTLAANLGAEKHVLTTSEMPSHTHVQNAHGHVINSLETTGSTADRYSPNSSVYNIGTNSAANTTNYYAMDVVATNQNTGGGTSHNNVQPSLVLNYIIKT